jgi:two-component system chemotaxis sensor kinase CheA
MDIVKEVVESLRGFVEISSEPGRGTKVSMRLPLTLAIIKAIIFRDEGETYALPISSVMEIRRMLPEYLESVSGTLVFNHREGLVPLMSIKGENSRSGKAYILLVGVARKRAAVIADEIIGEQSLVIKALDDMASISMAAGASILGDGRVVLILDPLVIIKRASGEGQACRK